MTTTIADQAGPHTAERGESGRAELLHRNLNRVRSALAAVGEIDGAWDRGEHGVFLELWQRQLAPRVILTGGRGEGDTTSEAAVSSRYLRSRGIPADAFLLDPGAGEEATVRLETRSGWAAV